MHKTESTNKRRQIIKIEKEKERKKCCFLKFPKRMECSKMIAHVRNT